ncbi:hypothetical protein [Metapseudomonas furukawaii]|uniref:Phage protein n=2 Tax=Metapseudomonas furukawaii TaxID=1149133 RepID=A0AAD1C5Q8_METFU|nr:hypothetical protein [Pseudomonas furukawaii]ELS25677.1 hypothetical protein ppKF707_0773 [Pseudomonas furukawaii]BAU76134.1 phage protein [Pseudomonas furukawaii]
MVGFSELVEDMDEQIMSSLGDAVGQYLDGVSGRLHCGIELIIDRNLQQSGPDGVFLTDAVGITCRRAALGCVARGGVFIVGPTRYLVEEIIADDGHMVTAACQVQP